MEKPYALMRKPLCLGCGDPDWVFVKSFKTLKEARKYCKDKNPLFHKIIREYSIK